jgi:plastocyanin domain-containing protein
MSSKLRIVAFVTLSVVGLAVFGVVLAKVRGGDDDLREIRFVARGMAYVDETTGAANPTLRVKRGERIRLVLTNDDPGYSHNLISPVLGVSTPLLPSGRTHSVDFVVPDVPGLSTYACEPHSEMMRGNIAIE